MCSSLYFNNPLAAVFSILVFPATFLKKTSTNKKWNKGSQVYTRLIVYSHQELKIENEHPAGSMTAFPLFTRVWPQWVWTKSSCVSHICFTEAHLKTHCPECDLAAATGSVNVCCTLCVSRQGDLFTALLIQPAFWCYSYNMKNV